VGVLKVLVDGVWRKVGCGTGSAAGIADDFNRTDGPTLVADRSDGGLWTVAGSDWELADGRLIRTTSGVGSPLSDRWVYADYGFDQMVTVVTKFNFMFLDGGMGWYVAVDAGGTAGFAVVYDANFPRMELVDLATNSAIASPVAAPSPDGTERTMTITYDYTSGAITVDINGTNYFTETSPSLYTDTGLGLYSYRPYATYQCYYDDVLVTGTGGAVPGRLRLWTGTEWVREACDDDVFGSGIWDNFDRADSATSLGTAGSGQTWTAINGTWGITSDTAYQVTSSTQAIAVVETGLADCLLELDVDSGIPAGGGLSWRVVDNNDHWFWDIDASGTGGSGGGSVYKRVGGTLTQVRTGLPDCNHKRMGVDLSGSTIDLLIDGVVVDTITDSTHSTATKHGLRDYSGFAVFDNFSVDGGGPIVAHPLKIEDPDNPGTWITVACMVPEP
jgi:hypothetical protein